MYAQNYRVFAGRFGTEWQIISAVELTNCKLGAILAAVAAPAPRSVAPVLFGHCPACGAAVPDGFVPARLVTLPEPHASVLELFLRVRGNAKDVERELGLSYPTVRARLEDAFVAAQSLLDHAPDQTAAPLSWRSVILEGLERGVLTPAEAVARLHAGVGRESSAASGTAAGPATPMERKRVLAMVAAGDLTTDDADAVLEALVATPTPAPPPIEDAPVRGGAAAFGPPASPAAEPAPAWRALVVRVTEGGNARVNARLPLELARDVDRFLPRQAKHYLNQCGVELETLLKTAGRFDDVRGSWPRRWAILLGRLASLPGDGTLAHVRDGDVEVHVALE